MTYNIMIGSILFSLDPLTSFLFYIFIYANHKKLAIPINGREKNLWKKRIVSLDLFDTCTHAQEDNEIASKIIGSWKPSRWVYVT